MITWGRRPNTNQESWQSLGAVATGNVNIPVRFRSGGGSTSLHPLQRTGQVSSASHAMMASMRTFQPSGLGSGPPAAQHNTTRPPVVPVGKAGTSLDPRMRV